MEKIEIINTENRDVNYYIELKNRYYNKNINQLQYTAIKNLMFTLRCALAFKTSLCYHMPPPDKDLSIHIPIDILTDADVTSLQDLFKSKVKQLKKYLEKEINYESMEQVDQLVFSSLELYKFDYSKMLYVTSPYFKNTIDINLKKPTLGKTEIYYHKFDNDEIVEVVNPYLTESLICVDFSCPYSDMSFSHNALHLYEHVMTKPFACDKSRGDVKINDRNGYTTSSGLCYVFVSCLDQKTFKKLFNDELKWIYESRDKEFWVKNRKTLEMETERTISESQDSISVGNFARATNLAYSHEYNTEIFRYWSNRSFNILIIHPYKSFKISDTIITELIHQYPIQHVDRPIISKFKYLPYANVCTRSKYSSISKKIDESKIREILTYLHKNRKSIESGYIGVDVLFQEIEVLRGKVEYTIFEHPTICTILTHRKLFDKLFHQQIIVDMLISTLGYTTGCMRYDPYDAILKRD